MLIQGNNLWVPRRRPAGEDSASVRQPGVEPRRRARRLELGRPVRRPEQRRHAGPVPDQRLRLGRRASSYWYDFSEIAVGHSSIIADAANWPAMSGRSLSGYQRKRVWLNDGAGTLHRGGAGRSAHRHLRRPRRRAGRSSEPRRPRRASSPTSAARCWSTGTRSTRHGTGSTSSWRARASNRSAIGARVELHWNGQVQLQESAAAAASARRTSAGCTSAWASREVERAVIRWPSGQPGSRSIDAPGAWTACTAVKEPVRHELAHGSTTASCRRS